MSESNAENDHKAEEHNALFFRAFGRFFYAYTDLEHQLTCIVRNVVVAHDPKGLSAKVGAAVLSGGRMAVLKDTIKRLLRVTKADEEIIGFTARLFSQLGDIQFFRDRLAHHWTKPLTGDLDHMWINSDFAAAREDEKVYTFHTSALVRASDDVLTIKNRTDGLFRHYIKHVEVPETDLSPIAWRYKSALLVQHHPKSDDSQPPPPPQPRS